VHDDIYASRDLLNRLNYFPVADFDTGNTLSEFWAGFASSLLLRRVTDHLGQAIIAAARHNTHVPGNSATIMCAWLAGFGTALHDLSQANTRAFGQALRKGAEAARDAVPDPVPGTMLTVYDAAAAAADQPPASFDDLLRQLSMTISVAVRQHRVPVARHVTARPQEDAGAFAMRLMFDAIETVLARPAEGENALVPVLPDRDSSIGYRAEHALQHGVEIQLLAQIPLDAIDALKSELADLGDSLVITPEPATSPRSPPAWQIHLHTEHPDSVTALCARYGSLLRDTASPVVSTATPDSGPSPEPTGRRRIIVIGDDDVDVDPLSEGVDVFHGGEQARMLSHALQVAVRGEVIILAIGGPSALIAEDVARLARQAARRGGRYAAIAVLPAPNLRSARIAAQHHQGDRLGDATIRMYEAMQDAHL